MRTVLTTTTLFLVLLTAASSPAQTPLGSQFTFIGCSRRIPWTCLGGPLDLPLPRLCCRWVGLVNRRCRPLLHRIITAPYQTAAPIVVRCLEPSFPSNQCSF